MERFKKCKAASLVSESPDAYASITLPLVWISQCFTQGLRWKFHLLFMACIYRCEWDLFNSSCV